MKQTIGLFVLLYFASSLKAMENKETDDAKHKQVLALIDQVDWRIKSFKKYFQDPWPEIEKVYKISQPTVLKPEKNLKPQSFLYGEQLINQLLQDQIPAQMENVTSSLTNVFEQSVNASDIDDISIETLLASIEVLGQRQKNIHIQILKKDAVPKLFTEIIKSKKKKRLMVRDTGEYEGSVMYRILLPLEYIKISLRSNKGTISVKNLKGFLSADSAKSNIEIDGFDGDGHIYINKKAKIRNIKGSIFLKGDGVVDAEDIHGEMRARVRGNLFINNVRGNINVSSQLGDIECLRVQDRIVVETANGRIVLYDVCGKIIAISQDGDIDMRLLNSKQYNVWAAIKGGAIALCSQKLDSRLRIQKILNNFECPLIKNEHVLENNKCLKMNLGSGGPNLILLESRTGTISIEESS